MFAYGTASQRLKGVNPEKYPDHVKLAGKPIEIDTNSIERTRSNISSLLVREVGTEKFIPVSSSYIETNDPVVLSSIQSQV